MAISKRKRTLTHRKANKRQRNTPESRPSGGYWKARSILDERIVDHKNLEYRIEWVDIDPATKRPYEPTWEPAENATDLLIAEWNHSKAGANKAGKVVIKPSRRQSRETTRQGAPLPPIPPPRPARTSRVIESSPDEPPTHTSTLISAQSTPAQSDGTLSQAAPYHTPPRYPPPSPQVRILQATIFDRHSYDYWSQLPFPSSSTGSIQPSRTSSSQSSCSSGLRRYLSSGIVYDSECGEDEENGSASDLPTCQNISASPQVHNQIQRSTHEVLGIRLTTSLKVLGPTSPVVSIPETEPGSESDIIEDSQLLIAVLPKLQEDQREVLDTSGSVYQLHILFCKK
jgi:hypothetical protein